MGGSTGPATFPPGFAADPAPEPASVLPVSVTAAGVAVAQNVSADANNLAKLGTDNRVLVDSADVEALATIDVCDAFGVPLYKAFAP